jgi:23S rRNA (adenine2503-C2)-methyltransferase
MSVDHERPDLLSFTPAGLNRTLSSHFRERGQPGYRSKQVIEWLYRSDVPSFDAMTNLPVAEREALGAGFRIGEPEAARVSESVDGTVKHLWKLSDGELIESVLIPSEGRMTLCLSSQAGCALGCTFCATGWSGFRRQLTAGEIVGQFRASRRWATADARDAITNVVYMGMGEPLANREAVFRSLTILNQGFEVGARRITVSTVGLVPGIEALADRPEQFRLALSLHAPASELRSKLIPLERRYPLPMVVSALRRFQERGGKRITFEYTMIDGVNDDPALAPELARLALELQAFVNLIPFNPIPWQSWRPSPGERIRIFASRLEQEGVPVAVREPRGRDIEAACGQLRANALVGIEKGMVQRANGPRSTDE